MPRIEPTIIIGQCTCGEVLIKDYPDSSPYWDKSQDSTKRANLMYPKKVLCPGCGGDPSIPMGGFYHPRYHQQRASAHS